MILYRNTITIKEKKEAKSMAKIESDEIKLEIRIAEMETLTFEMPRTDLHPSPTQVNFTVSINHNVDVSRKAMSVVVSTLLHGATQAERLAFLELKITYQFSDVSQVFIPNRQNNTLEMNAQLMLMIYSTSLSTTRGVLYTLLKDSPLEKIYLPIIDSAQFLPAMPKL